MKSQLKMWFFMVLIGVPCLILSSCRGREEGFESLLDEDQHESVSAGFDLDPMTPVPICGGSLMPFISSFDILQTSDLIEPEPRRPFTDPVFGTCLVRVTDRKSDISANDPSGGIKNEYSRVQSFNADGRYLIARSVEAFWYLYDAESLQPLGLLPLDVEPRWSPTDPHLIYFTSETRLVSFNIQTGQQTTVHDFRDDFSFEPAVVWTRFEGSPSADGRFWGMMAQDQEWLAAAYIIYDLEDDQVIASRSLMDWPEPAREVDSVTISPSGQFFLAYMDLFCEAERLGTDEKPCGLMVYDQGLKYGRGLLRIVGHSDLALDKEGREVLLYQDIDSDTISILDLVSGEITPLWSIDFSHSPIGFHFSGRALDMSGWGLVSTYSGGYPDNHTWMDDQVFAVELKAGGQVIRLAHTHSLVDEEQEHDYWAEPQATVNQDFTRVLFTSNWGRSGSDQVEMYMIYLPEGWISQLP